MDPLHATACVSLSCSYRVTYPIEFFCLSVAKLLVLDRMMTFAVAREHGKTERWSKWGRVVMAVVVTGNLVGLGGNIASAVFYKEAGDLAAAVAAGFAANSTSAADDDSLASQTLAYTKALGLGQSTGSFQEFSEVAVLLIIIASFTVTGSICARRIAASLRTMKSQTHRVAGQQLRLQLVSTVAAVFVTFLLRAVFSTIYALASASQNIEGACPNQKTKRCDTACYTTSNLMLRWLTATPEFQAIVVLIASPLSLLVALWGMTSKRMLLQMKQDSVVRLNTIDDE